MEVTENQIVQPTYDGKKVYYLTPESAVFDSEGESLETKLATILGKLEDSDRAGLLEALTDIEVLKNKIDGSKDLTPALTDCNTAISTGYYNTTQDTLNLPERVSNNSNYGMLFTVKTNSYRAQQIWFKYDQNEIWMREFNNVGGTSSSDTSWKSWEPLSRRIIVDWTAPNNTTREISFPLDLVQGVEYKVKISGAATTATDIYVQVNNQTSNYHMTGFYTVGTSTADEELTPHYGFRTNKIGWYYGHALRTDLSVINGRLSIEYAPTAQAYRPFYQWSQCAALQGGHIQSHVGGWLNVNTQKITTIKFFTNGSSVFFKQGTKIQIIQDNSFNF